MTKYSTNYPSSMVPSAQGYIRRDICHLAGHTCYWHTGLYSSMCSQVQTGLYCRLTNNNNNLESYIPM